MKNYKKEIWRSNASLYVRFVFGLVVAMRYLTIVGAFFTGISVMSETSRFSMVQFKDALKSVDVFDEYNVPMNQLNSIIPVSKAVLLLYIGISILISVLITLWYHLGKSRVITTIHFATYCLCTVMCVAAMCKLPMENSALVYSFAVLLLFTLSSFLVMRSTYKYHHILYKEKIRLDSPAAYTDRKQYTPDYQVKKPRVDISYNPGNETVRNRENKIKIDGYSNGDQNASVYQNVSEQEQPIVEELKEQPIVEEPVEQIKKSDEEIKDIVSDLPAEDETIKDSCDETVLEDSKRSYEEEDGIKVDTSLGYRRITFDDL